MSCELCHREEPCVDKTKRYLCGSCVVKIMSMDKIQKRVYIDSLYMADKEEEANFLEEFFDGQISKLNTKKPKLIIRKKIKL